MLMDHFHEAVLWITVSFVAFVVGVHSFLSFLYKNQVITPCCHCVFMSRELILSCLCVESPLFTWKWGYQNLTMAVQFNHGCEISSLFWIKSTIAQWLGLSFLWEKSPAEVLLWQVGRSRSHSLSFLLKIKGESYSRSFP